MENDSGNHNEITVEEGDIIKEIKRNTTREKEVVQALKKEDGLTWEEDGVVYMEGRIYVPNNKKIKEEILKENHNLADVGHPGQHRMLELIKRTYWWPGLKKDVKKYVQGCFKCQQNKVQHQRCYDLKLKVLSNKTTLVLSNTRELNRVPSTK